MTHILPPLFILISGLCLLAALAALWFSLRGLFGGDEDEVLSQTEASRRRGELLDEKSAVLASIKDLSFEREVGKVSDADYERLNRQFRRRAKQILRELDRDLGVHQERARELLEAAAGSPAAPPAAAAPATATEAE